MRAQDLDEAWALRLIRNIATSQPAYLEGAWDRVVYPGGRPAANPPDQLPSTVHEQPAWTRIIVILLSRSV